jgi:ribosomal protein S18 acetylase RimI-like enzyme
MMAKSYNMNFYSEDIINDIVDHSPVENILDEIERFRNSVEYLLIRHSCRTIDYRYTLRLLADQKNQFAFHCFDQEFAPHNCPTVMIYRKYKDAPTTIADAPAEALEIHYYILMICTANRYKGMGYASKLLDGFVERICIETRNQTKPVKIVLSSMETAVTFYESYGFKWTRKSLADYPKLMRHEKYEKDKEYFMMELPIQRA